MKTLQGVFRNGKIEALDELKAPNNTKLLIVVTDEVLPDAVASNLPDVSVLERIRRRTRAEVSSDQQVSARQKLKQITSQVEGKLPFESLDEASRSLRRDSHDHD
ncbi:MAG: hypothetical protein KDC45_08910 [Bacteroidetes bacterium]|nr:hypothetical protein [Bacteroidota bacterium]